MKREIISTVLFFLVIFQIACDAPPKNSGVPGTEVRSNKQRITEPQSTDVPALVAQDTGFALDLYQKLAEEPGNLFFSPHSISVALAMTWAGARGNTETQMASVLHFGLEQERLHPAFDWLDLALNSRGQGASGKDEEPFRLHLINRLFGQVGYEFMAPFLDTLALNYGAGLHLLDFAADPEDSRQKINLWVANQTEDRIDDLIPQDAISKLTRLVLVNAIYFNAAWQKVFNDELTHDGVFNRLDGSQVTVPMMVQGKSLPYAEGQGWQAVEIPYEGNELSMVVIVPQEDFSTFEKSLDGDKLASILSGLGSGYATLTMPRFAIDGYAISLKTMLSELGMKDAFITGVADFSGMDGADDLFIGNVLHQAFVTVDEYGTEAAAATAVSVEATSIIDITQHVDADRPFIFLIRDIQTEAILFIGRVVDPS